MVIICPLCNKVAKAPQGVLLPMFDGKQHHPACYFEAKENSNPQNRDTPKE